MKDLWDIWKIRFTVSLSLILQIILLLLGNRRKVSSSNMLRMVLWVAYTAADSAATVSLSVISSILEDYILVWAPLILIQFGGQDTITAYSMEDNDSWHRHLLQLVGAIYVLLIFVIPYYGSNYTTDNITVAALIIAGVIKTGERIWSMWSVSRDHLRESLIPPGDPGPSYAKLSRKQTIGASSEEESSNYTAMIDIEYPMTELDVLLCANNFFGIFKPLFPDLELSFKDVQNSLSFFRNRSSSEAFKVIETELGLTYDFFYTKAVLAYSQWGVVLRFITFSCTLPSCALILHSFAYSISFSYLSFEDYITYLLLVGAIALEIIAVFVRLDSDWAVLWLGNVGMNILGAVLFVLFFKLLRCYTYVVNSM